MSGQQGATINVTLVHPSGPDPGVYKIELLGYDEDNDVSSPFTLSLDVPVLSQTRLEFDYIKIPVHPINTLRLMLDCSISVMEISAMIYSSSLLLGGILDLTIYLPKEGPILPQQD